MTKGIFKPYLTNLHTETFPDDEKPGRQIYARGSTALALSIFRPKVSE